jgi:hypothetical protein
MNTKTKRILIISGIFIAVVGVGSYAMKSKIMSLVKGNDNKRVAAQQSADIKEIAWTSTESGNQPMIDYLHQVYDAVNKPGLRFMNTAIVESLLGLPIPDDATGMYQWYFDVCNQLLNCGRVNDAVNKIDEFEKSPQFKKLTDAQYGGWYYTKGLVYLRYGEVENCIGLHNAESCIWPLSKAAQSVMKDGPTMAVKAYSDCLKYEPENLSAMWLMNIAYMQLGTYPEAVPAEYLVPPSSFKSEYDVPRFKNVAIDLGVDNPNMCGGVICDDFNNDDLIDIFTCGWGLHERSFLLLNKGDGTFDDVSKQAGISEYPGGLMIQQTDYNNDGFLDVWVSRGAWYSNFGILPSSLLRNNGDTTFTDVTREVGIWTTRPSQASTWADFNNDGWLDLYIGNEASRKGDDINDCQLWINEKGKFREIAEEAGINVNSFVKGVTSGDYDNDGDADVYISANGFKNYLFRNDTKKGSAKMKFTNVTKAAGVQGPMSSFPCWFFDFDNDGWLDIMNFSYSANISDNDIPAEYMGKPTDSDKTALYRNNGDGTFTDIAGKTGLANRTFLVMGSSYGDFDMDGWIDFYVGTGKPDMRSLTPNRMLRNDGGKYYQEVSTAAGVGVLQKGHEISFADLNNDGYPEIFAQMGGAYEASGFYDCLFENPASFQNNWISIDLTGTKSNKIARGARLKITTIENGKERNIYEWVTSGSSFGANSLRQEIGLGKSTSIKQIEITWPTSGIVTVLKDVQMNQFIAVTEGKEGFTPILLKPFVFQSTPEKSFTHKMMETMDHGNDRYMDMQHMH